MRSASRKEMYPVRIPSSRPARLSRSSMSSLLIWSKHLYRSIALPQTHLRIARASSAASRDEVQWFWDKLS
eukprot:3315354-Alexandrium_andersonii.AAC.1